MPRTRSSLWALALIAPACNTAAQFELAAEEVAGAALIGVQQSCDGDGSFRGTLVLINQQGGVIREGSSRLPSLPASAAGSISFEVQLQGAAAEIEVTGVEVVQQPETAAYRLVFDRSGSACGPLPPGPWEARCNFTPCGKAGDDCDVLRGCCAQGEACVAATKTSPLEQLCVQPDSGCDPACAPDRVCRDGGCVPRLLAPIDRGDTLVQSTAASLARLLETDRELSPPVASVRAYASSEAGLQALSPGPLADFSAAERALEQSLLPPYGRDRLLENLSGLAVDEPTLVWALRPGPAADLSGHAPHTFLVRDHPALSPEEDRAFAAAACATGGVYARFPADAAVDTDALAGSWAPGAARSHLRLALQVRPAPNPGDRLTGELRIDVRAMVGKGSKPPLATLTVPIDLIIGGGP